MAIVFADRVREQTSTTGTGSLTLLGAIVGYRTFSAGVGNGNETYYSIVDDTTNEWEVGRGSVGASVLSRDTVLASSNANALVNFGAGTKTVDAVAAAAFFDGALTNTEHATLDHTGITGVPAPESFDTVAHQGVDHTNPPWNLLDETAHDALDHTGLTGVNNFDSTAHDGVDHTAAPFNLLDTPGHNALVTDVHLSFDQRLAIPAGLSHVRLYPNHASGATLADSILDSTGQINFTSGGGSLTFLGPGVDVGGSYVENQSTSGSASWAPAANPLFFVAALPVAAMKMAAGPTGSGQVQFGFVVNSGVYFQADGGSPNYAVVGLSGGAVDTGVAKDLLTPRIFVIRYLATNSVLAEIYALDGTQLYSDTLTPVTTSGSIGPEVSVALNTSQVRFYSAQFSQPG